MRPATCTSISLRIAAAFLVCSAALLALLGARTIGAAPASASLPRCKTINAPKDLVDNHASDLAVVQQGYRCILRHYLTGARLDDRVLLRGAAGAVTQLVASVMPSGAPMLPAPTFTGDRQVDWQAFARFYDAALAQFKPLPVVQQAFAEASLQGMAASLHDDHTAYLPATYMKAEISQLNPNAPSPTLGFVTSPAGNAVTSLYITDVFPGTPAAAAGLEPGDTVQSVNGRPLIANGQFDWSGYLTLQLPQIGHTVTLTVLRPRTGARITVHLAPRSLVTPATTERVVAGSMAYVKLYAFTTNAASQVFSAIQHLGLGASMTGLILDLRGNGGGVAEQAVRIVSALKHNAVVDYQVDGQGHRDADRTDNRVSLLHKPVVVLIDSDSASSSEVVAGAVRDYHLGTLVGTRSAGALAAAEFYGLNDGSGLEITEDRVLGPLGEKIDGVGIAPDQQIVTSAADLSAGRDPAIDQAVRDIRRAVSTR